MPIIHERTHFATKTHLARILDGAKRVGELHLLYWMIEMKVSTSLTGGRQPTLAAATYPHGWVPLVGVAPDPELTRHHAELLLTLIKDANRGRPIEFGLTLTAADIIAGQRTYQWGDPIWDCICVYCGATWQSTTVADEVCTNCRGVPLRSPPDR